MIAGKHTIELYKKLYNLPTLRQEETVSDSSLFRLYDRRHYFVVIVIYNLKGQCLLIRDFNKNIGWELPGGFIQDEEVIEDSVNRVVLSETGLEVDELCPIAIVENIFKHKNKKISHFGLSFMALSRGKVKNFPSNIQSSFSKNIANKIAFQNEKIVKIARDKLTSKKRQPPFSEIDNIKRNDFSFVHMLHESILKKIGRSSSIKIRDKIFQLVNNHPKTILDVSCGDNSLINELYFMENDIDDKK